MISFLHKLLRCILFFCLLCGSVAISSAAPIAPDVLVRQVTDEVLDVVRSDKKIQGGDANRVNELVRDKVLPHFNFIRMTALAVGRDWRKATPDQQKRLAQEFQTLLVRTYSNALNNYRDQTIDIRPLKMQASDNEVIVRTLIKQSGAQSVDIDYGLEKAGDTWKVFDVVVGGVSLVTNYRESFAQKIRADGIDGLIQWLLDKNKANQSSMRAM